MPLEKGQDSFRSPVSATPAQGPSLERAAHQQPIPGYRLIERIGKGGYGEVWKCEAPGGLFKAIKFVNGDLSGGGDKAATAEQELQSLQRVKLIRHPFLLSVERVEIVRDQLVIVTELADKNLLEVRNDYQNNGLPGIPRHELLSYLREAAEALDWMNLQFGLQHLDIKPQNLFLVSNHVKVADFGLVSSLWETASDQSLMAGTTPAYSPPEVTRGAISPFSDQYSLAIVYQEQLTGKRPFQAKTAQQLAKLHDKAPPDLSTLPIGDRPIVARALSKDPRQRYQTCLAFIEALRHAPSNHAPVRSDATTPAPSGFKPLDLSRDGESPGPEQQAVPSFAPWVVTRPPGSAEEPRTLESTQDAEEPPPAVGDVRAGLKFMACLEHSPLCEVWKVQTADGQLKAAKFIHGIARPDSQAERDGVSRLALLTHPGLARSEVAYHRPGRLILVSPLHGPTLFDRLQECRAQGWPALPRWELLGHLRAAAEALDYLHRQHGVYHLSLNPSTLICGAERFLVTDAGLMQWLWLPAGHSAFQLNALYSAPELFDRRSNPTCDQYSLALIYLEMLTGQHPHLGLAPRQLARLRAAGTPDLSHVPQPDRKILSQALSPSWSKRFETCTELIEALRAVSRGERPLLSGLPPVIASNWSFLPAGLSGPVPTPEQIISKLLSSALTPDDDTPMVSRLREGELLQTQFTAELSAADASRQLTAFCEQWHAEVICKDDEFVLARLWMPRGFLQRYISKTPGIEIQIQLTRGSKPQAGRVEVEVQVKPLGSKGVKTEELLREIGPVLVRSVREYLTPRSEQRARERRLLLSPLRVFPVLHNFHLGQPLECKARDISLAGVGFLAPLEPPTRQVYLDSRPNAGEGLVALLAQITRSRRRDDGWFEVGASFSLE